jgi:hypothetical protein
MAGKTFTSKTRKEGLLVWRKPFVGQLIRVQLRVNITGKIGLILRQCATLRGMRRMRRMRRMRVWMRIRQ